MLGTEGVLDGELEDFFGFGSVGGGMIGEVVEYEPHGWVGVGDFVEEMFGEVGKGWEAY